MKRLHVHVAVHDLAQSIAWESFHTLDSVPVYGSDTRTQAASQKAKGACCAPAIG